MIKSATTLPETKNRISGRQSGSVLFLILIAVALFAALSYAVSQSSRSSGPSIKQEKETLQTAVTDDCTASVDTAMMRLKMVKGCDPTQISYELPGGGNANPQAPTDKRCHLFNTNGGGIVPCGAYLEVTSVPTGTITLGNTTTIARMASGPYLRCMNWMGPTNKRCTIELSTNGTSFSPGIQSACLSKSDNSARGFSDALAMRIGLVSAMCSAACGSTRVTDYSIVGSTGTGYFEDDYTLSPFSGACSFSVDKIECGCW